MSDGVNNLVAELTGNKPVVVTASAQVPESDE